MVSSLADDILDFEKDERASSKSPSEKAGDRGVTDEFRLFGFARDLECECLCKSLFGFTSAWTTGKKGGQETESEECCRWIISLWIPLRRQVRCSYCLCS